MNVVVHRRDAEYAKEINPMPSEKSNDWKAKKNTLSVLPRINSAVSYYQN